MFDYQLGLNQSSPEHGHFVWLNFIFLLISVLPAEFRMNNYHRNHIHMEWLSLTEEPQQ